MVVSSRRPNKHLFFMLTYCRDKMFGSFLRILMRSGKLVAMALIRFIDVPCNGFHVVIAHYVNARAMSP